MATRLTCVGVLDAAGPRVFLAGRDLDDFPEAARPWKLLVTFNGLSFDVPVLRARVPRLAPAARARGPAPPVGAGSATGAV